MVKKISYVNTDIEATGITLLSSEEYKAAREHIPLMPVRLKNVMNFRFAAGGLIPGRNTKKKRRGGKENDN